MLRGDPRIARLMGICLTRPKIITGQEFLTSGSVLVGGENPLENDAVLGRMIFVKERQIYPDIKVKRALEAASWFYPNWDAELAGQLMEDFNLPEKRPIKKLSRGMNSAVGIVIGLAVILVFPARTLCQC
jgi:ABC-2 type transport system ATP-binding protein